MKNEENSQVLKFSFVPVQIGLYLLFINKNVFTVFFNFLNVYYNIKPWTTTIQYITYCIIVVQFFYFPFVTEIANAIHKNIFGTIHTLQPVSQHGCLNRENKSILLHCAHRSGCLKPQSFLSSRRNLLSQNVVACKLFHTSTKVIFLKFSFIRL